MRSDVLQRLGLGALEAIKVNPTFPYKTGNLKFNATYVSFIGEDQFTIVFDETVAPYVKYLEDGTKRSSKHQGFISQRATDDVINYLAKTFNVNVEFILRQGETEYYGQTGNYRNKKSKKDPFGQ